jgi:hypothetical protein
MQTGHRLLSRRLVSGEANQAQGRSLRGLQIASVREHSVEYTTFERASHEEDGQPQGATLALSDGP